MPATSRTFVVDASVVPEPEWVDVGQPPRFGLLLLRDGFTFADIEPALADAAAACDEAARRLDEVGPDLVGWDGPYASPAGPVIADIGFADVPSLITWCAAIADSLSARGWSGRGVVLNPNGNWRVRHEPGFFGVPGTALVGASMAYRLDNPSWMPHKHELDPYALPAHIPEIAANLAGWVMSTGTAFWVAPMSGAVRCDGDILPSYVEWMTQRDHYLPLYSLSDQGHIRSAINWSHGHVVLCGRDPGDTWEDRVTRLTHVLTDQADLLDYGMLVNPARTESAYYSKSRHLRHLWAARIPHPSGTMILTSSHLEHAGTLQDWVVRRAGEKRWLVQSRHLDAWFQQEQPTPGAIQAARDDFADALIRFDMITLDEGYPDNP